MFPVLHSQPKPSDLMDGSQQSWPAATNPRDFTGGCQDQHLLGVCWLPSCEVSLEHFSFSPLWADIEHLAPFGRPKITGLGNTLPHGSGPVRTGWGCWAPPWDAVTPIMGAPATGFRPKVPPWMGQGCGTWLSLPLGCDILDLCSQSPKDKSAAPEPGRAPAPPHPPDLHPSLGTGKALWACETSHQDMEPCARGQ